MKKILSFYFIWLFLISSINPIGSNNYVEIRNDIEIDETVYTFFSNFFSEYSKNLITNGTREIMDEKDIYSLSPKYYDRQGYFNSFFCYDKDLYVIDKIIIKSKKQTPKLDNFYLELGILFEEYYEVSFSIKTIYDKYGNIYHDKKEFSDRIGIFRYSDKCLLSELFTTSAYNWVLEKDEETMVKKLKNGDLNIKYNEDVNHYQY